MTPDQIDIIKTTWKIPAANPIDSGEVILLKFFEKYPHNQQKFLAFKNLPLESLKVICKNHPPTGSNILFRFFVSLFQLNRVANLSERMLAAL